MANVVIKQLTEPEEIMALWLDIQKVPMIGIEPRVLLARALDGSYHTIIGLFENKYVGFMVYGVDRDVLTIIALYLPTHARAFLEAFNSWCLSLGVHIYYATSAHDPKAFARLFDLTYIYGVFSKEVK